MNYIEYDIIYLSSDIIYNQTFLEIDSGEIHTLFSVAPIEHEQSCAIGFGSNDYDWAG